MKRMNYAAQLAHPLWQRRRLDMLNSANWQCTVCGCSDKTLHVHHRQYFKGRMAWEYSDVELQVVCYDCHEANHALDEKLKAILVLVPPQEALSLLAGFYSALLPVDLTMASIGNDKDTFEGGMMAADFRFLPADIKQQMYAARDKFLTDVPDFGEGGK